MTGHRVFTLLAFSITMLVLFTACPGAKETYNKYDISFDYPPDMVVQEEGVIGFTEESTEMAGRLLFTKPRSRIEVFWTGPFDDADSSYIAKILGSYMAGRKENHPFYLGDVVNSERNGHTILEARFYTEGEDGIFLNIAGAWYCDKSRRVFTICSGAFWDKPALVTDGRTMIPEWPKPRSDASCKIYENLMASLHCH